MPDIERSLVHVDDVGICLPKSYKLLRKVNSLLDQQLVLTQSHSLLHSGLKIFYAAFFVHVGKRLHADADAVFSSYGLYTL